MHISFVLQRLRGNCSLSRCRVGALLTDGGGIKDATSHDAYSPACHDWFSLHTIKFTLSSNSI